jgi:thiamine biosynthesis protein ThiS
MWLKINGEIVRDLKATNVKELLDELQVRTGRVAVEVNLAVIKRAEYGNHRLNEGDTVEIVNFVGGGEEDGWTMHL